MARLARGRRQPPGQKGAAGGCWRAARADALRPARAQLPATPDGRQQPGIAGEVLLGFRVEESTSRAASRRPSVSEEPAELRSLAERSGGPAGAGLAVPADGAPPGQSGPGGAASPGLSSTQRISLILLLIAY